MWHAADGMGWWMIWGGLMMVVFWGAIIALIVWAIQAGTQRGGGQDRSANAEGKQRGPLDIAKERYARGEIGRDDFEQIRKDLDST